MAQVEQPRDDAGVYTGPDSKTIPLKTPVKGAGGEIREITIQEPTAKQLSQYFSRQNSTNDNGIEAMVLLISLTSGVLPSDIEKLKQRDLDACGEFLAVFTPVPPKKDSPN
jgi:hypothetical protein